MTIQCAYQLCLTQPIHFDVFLQMALDMGMSVKRTGLKAKVRTFLDQKVTRCLSTYAQTH